MTTKDQIIKLLERCSAEERLEVFNYLRKSIRIHPLEGKLNVQAELILEAIDRASDLTLRGIRGIIAEVALLVDVLKNLDGWNINEIIGDATYDFLIEDSVGPVNIQVKMQRKVEGIPMVRRGKFVVEVQRTRGGTDATTGRATRPYRFGQFDILAVSMQPSTNKWDAFLYTLNRWLIPRTVDPDLIKVLQPISPMLNDDWTDNLETCIEWFRSGINKNIASF